MKTRLALLFVMALLLLALVLPTAARRSCSGDDCGCGLEHQECLADCALLTGDAYTACVADCRRQTIQCSKACCGARTEDGSPNI